jgi:hypothetical protein
MRSDEALTALLFESTHAGAEMRHNASQARGEWDFDLVFPNGEHEPVEVTISTVLERQRIYAAILNDHGLFVDRRICENDWHVTPYQNANIRRIRRDIDRYLAEVERAGTANFFDGRASNNEPVQRICTELRIEAGTQCTWRPPGRIALGLPGQGGTLSADNVIEDVEAEANKADNRAKLGRSLAPNRHLAVILGDLNGLGRASMLRGFVPDRPATLPAEITVAWVITRLNGATTEYLVWRNRSGAEWEDIGIVNVTDADIAARAG